MRSLIFGVFLLLLTVDCLAADTGDWYYFSAMTTVYGEWQIETGTATVDIQGDKVKIVLCAKAVPVVPDKLQGPGLLCPAETLEGTVSKDGRFTVVNTYLYTDAIPETIYGQRSERVSSGFKPGTKDIFETINFSAGYLTIGLSRRTTRPATAN